MFQAPQPIEPWEGVKEVKSDGSACYSRNIMKPEEFLGSEDCLYLNVFTPMVKFLSILIIYAIISLQYNRLYNICFIHVVECRNREVIIAKNCALNYYQISTLQSVHTQYGVRTNCFKYSLI